MTVAGCVVVVTVLCECPYEAHVLQQTATQMVMMERTTTVTPTTIPATLPIGKDIIITEGR